MTDDHHRAEDLRQSELPHPCTVRRLQLREAVRRHLLQPDCSCDPCNCDPCTCGRDTTSA